MRRYLAPMIFIPTGTDRDEGRRPWCVWAILLLCVLTTLVTRGLPDADAETTVALRMDAYQRWTAPSAPAPDSPAPGTFASFRLAPSSATLSQTFGISRATFNWWQPFTSQFLHARGWSFHLIFNMFFLVAFGIVLENRLGHVGFLALYLLGGAISGLTEAWLGSALEPIRAVVPAIGASGAVSALMGAVFALHPRANIRGYSLLPFGPAMISVRWMLGFAVALDIARTLMDWRGGGHSGVATLAHLGGLAFGVSIGLALLASGLLPRNDYDLWFSIRQWYRRRQMRQATLAAGTSGEAGALPMAMRAQRDPRAQGAHDTLRNTLRAAHRERDHVLAARLYLELLQREPHEVIDANIALDVANELARVNRNADAVAAYRRFLADHSGHAGSVDARLMLAVILLRRLGDKQGAREPLAMLAQRTLDGPRADLFAALVRECAENAP